MVSEDFSFPKIISNNPLPQFTFSPSLWRVSSIVYPESNIGDHEEEEAEDHNTYGVEREEAPPSLRRKSFSHLEYYDEEMKKMDMLWEDFNEDLKRVSSLRSTRKLEPSSTSVELQYAPHQALKLKTSETGIGCNSGMIYRHRRRPSYSMLAMMKSLKKIFSLRNLV